MFGDSVWEEEERLRRAEDARDSFERTDDDGDTNDIMAIGGLDERLRLRQAITDLLREVGGC